MLQRKLPEKQKTSPPPLGFCPVKDDEEVLYAMPEKKLHFLFPVPNGSSSGYFVFQNNIEEGGAFKIGGSFLKMIFHTPGIFSCQESFYQRAGSVPADAVFFQQTNLIRSW